MTGANRGIGLEIARQLGLLGISVVVGARLQGRGDAAARTLRREGTDARAVRLDVTDDGSVQQAQARIAREFGHLDILVNNAAVAHDLFLDDDGLPMPLVREMFDTNVLGLMRVTRAMLPLLERSSAPRIVNQSSVLGSLSEAARRASWGRRQPLAYFASKAAVNAITLSYARELAPRGFKVNAVSPGWCATDMTRNQGPRSAAEGARIAVAMATVSDDGPNGSFVSEEGVLGW